MADIIKMSHEGILSIQRQRSHGKDEKEFVVQKCPFTTDTKWGCGDWCPHFIEDQGDYDIGDRHIRLCCDTIITFNNRIDER